MTDKSNGNGQAEELRFWRRSAVRIVAAALLLLVGVGNGIGGSRALQSEPAAPKVEAVDYVARERVAVLEATVTAQNQAILRELAGLRADVQALARTRR